MKKHIKISLAKINKDIDNQKSGIIKKFIHCQKNDGYILDRYYKKSDFKGILIDTEIITEKEYNSKYML